LAGKYTILVMPPTMIVILGASAAAAVTGAVAMALTNKVGSSNAGSIFSCDSLRYLLGWAACVVRCDVLLCLVLRGKSFYWDITYNLLSKSGYFGCSATSAMRAIGTATPDAGAMQINMAQRPH